MSRLVTLGDEPETVTFDTDRGAISYAVEPYCGPGIYECSVSIHWADDD